VCRNGKDVAILRTAHGVCLLLLSDGHSCPSWEESGTRIHSLALRPTNGMNLCTTRKFWHRSVFSFQFSVFSRETVAAAIFGVRGLVTAFFFRRYVTEWQRFIQRPR
jgi:hypothetical protein